MKVVIAHLYYDLLNLCGECGNVRVLKNVLECNGIDVEIKFLTINDVLYFDEYDFVYIGHGIYDNLLLACRHLCNYKDDVKKYIKQRKVFLCTGNSYEMFANKINDVDGLGIFDFCAYNLDERLVDDIVGSSNFINEKVVGFINTQSFNDNNKNYFVNFNDKNEGIIYKNFIGTYTLGPLLARNPKLLQKLCNNILKLKKKKIVIKKCLPYMLEAYNDCLDRKNIK